MTKPIADYTRDAALSEKELRAAYRRPLEARPCACGGVVVADPVDPTDGVEEHQQTDRHRRWREWVET